MHPNQDILQYRHVPEQGYFGGACDTALCDLIGHRGGSPPRKSRPSDV
jgi:hypothetical protein